MSSDDKPFSVRMGIIPERVMQTKNLDAETLLRIVNVVLENTLLSPDFNQILVNGFFTSRTVGRQLFLHRGKIELHMELGQNAANTPPYWGSGFPRRVLDLLAVPDRWWAVLDFIEFALNMPAGTGEPIAWRIHDPKTRTIRWRSNRKQFISSLNSTLIEMNVGYRLMPTGKFVNVHSDEEAEEIGKACSGTSGPFAAARTHMKNAVADFRSMDKPNHANTVTEAIHAVESIVKELTGKEIRAGLHQLAKEGILPDVRADVGGENSFVAALEKYWTYANVTSRHGRKKGVEPPDRDTARFLLVTCATLVNYITTRHLAAGKSS